MGSKGLGELLKEFRLRIPVYQRAYAWKPEHVEDLLQDFQRAMDKGSVDYFVGSVVSLRRAKEDPEIVDGQQRLATTCIIISAIRDFFLFLNDQQGAELIEKDYLLSENLKTRVPQEHLKLSEHDHDFFLNTILRPPKDRVPGHKWRVQSHRRLAKAASMVAERLKKATAIYESDSDKKDVLYKWLDFLTDHAQVIYISVPDQLDAFVIFETLNDRGMDLSISDLLKTYVFGKAGKERIAEAQARWNTMLGVLESVSSSDMTTNFIHQLWSSRHGVTRKRELFQEITDKLSTAQEAVSFSNDLVESARVYAALRNSDHEFWNPYGGAVRQHIRVLNEHLGVWQIRTLLLAVIDKFSVAEVKRTMPLAVSWSVRYLVAGGSPGNLETYYAQHAVKVRTREIETAADLAKSMSLVIPSDELFRAAFESERVRNEHLARYYLHCLEASNAGEQSPHLLSLDNTEVASLEHVLPEAPSEEAWQHIPEEDRERLCYRIGNLALLAAGPNSKRGNDTFDAAKSTYQASAFALTNELAKWNQLWDEAAIDVRQKRLAEIAIKTWPI